MPPLKKGNLIDTNVILRYLMGDDPKQSPKATALMERLEKGDELAEIPEVVVTETVWTLERFYGVPRAEITAKLNAILSFAGVRSSQKRILLGALARYASSRADFVDCFLAAKSDSRKMLVYSFDEDFRKLGCGWEIP